MSSPAVTYCERYDVVAGRPDRPLSEAEASARYPHGPAFTVVLPRAGGAADVLLEIERGVSTVQVAFLDDDTDAEHTRYTFRRHRDVLFLAEAVEYEFPEDGRRGLTAVVRVSHLWNGADGAMAAALDTRAGEAGYGESRTDPAGHREPVPVFGDWAGLARYER